MLLKSNEMLHFIFNFPTNKFSYFFVFFRFTHFNFTYLFIFITSHLVLNINLLIKIQLHFPIFLKLFCVINLLIFFFCFYIILLRLSFNLCLNSFQFRNTFCNFFYQRVCTYCICLYLIMYAVIFRIQFVFLLCLHYILFTF